MDRERERERERRGVINEKQGFVLFCFLIVYGDGVRIRAPGERETKRQSDRDRARARTDS